MPALTGPEHALTRGLIIMHVNIWSFALAFVVMLLTTERDRWRYGKPWLQWLAFGAFLLVCVQGTLGGLRVTEVSIVLAMIHACTAQAFLCLTVVMAAALSPRWNEDASRNALRGGPAISAAGVDAGRRGLLPVDDRRGDAAFARRAVDSGFSAGVWPSDSADAG